MPPSILTHHDFHFSHVVARLRPDVSLATALSQVGAVQYQLHLEDLHAPVAEDVVSRSLLQDLGHGVKKPLIILLYAVGCMLLIGCLNVANLLVARSASRQKELAVRNALGARRGTLIRAQLIESLLISLAGGVAGVLLSLAATHWLVTAWKTLPSAQGIRPDGVVLAFACALIFMTATLAGLIPAISSTGKRAFAALQASSRSTTGNQSRTALRKTLLVVEIATTVVLSIAAGLLLKASGNFGLPTWAVPPATCSPWATAFPQQNTTSCKGERIRRNAAGARALHARRARRWTGSDHARSRAPERR